ncbi:class I SAM-dependent methyltransferase [Vallitalea sp. AN17-2]|uniref:Class I SAM-dependent methyltransferase n=1 Tax=Vallitalea maricola TaxID=3074433 RepID=A0ACB5UPZ7_9FIRM|nr:class I SAM-dependent methyltransferase [Vallitalea sp. AN17-2]
MWTDEYISKQLLEMHINPDINIASRKEESIDKTIYWILKQLGKNDGEILDLGCGPGLYTEKLAKKGYTVTGVDFSENSIEYAKNRAKQDNLDVNYICKDYLDLDFKEKFDLIIMIYCDFGVLSIEEREVFFKNVYNALKPGGIFIFDTLNKYTIDNLKFQRNWEFSQGGFWQDKPYLCLSQSSHFQENKAILDQIIIIDEENNYKIYRFWNHYFDEDDINNIFERLDFKKVENRQNILEDDGLYNDKGVTFYKATK